MGPWILGTVMGLLSLLGLFMASYATDGVFHGTGLAIFVFGVLVALSSAGDKAKLEDLGRKIAMHVAATGPLAVNVEELPAEAVERETTRLAVENARLQAILADVPAGVLLCSADHQIVWSLIVSSLAKARSCPSSVSSTS